MSAPVQLNRTGRPQRRQSTPLRQRASTAVLVVGTVVSLASLIGPDWVLRAGVAVALISAATSCALAWRELYLTKRRHARRLLAVDREHTDALRAERRHNADVLDTVRDRAGRWRTEVDRQQQKIAALRVENSALSTDLVSVRRQLLGADRIIAGLRQTVRDRDTELATHDALRDSVAVEGGGDANVQVLTQWARLERKSVPIADRTVVELSTQAPALPNFEADRRRA